MRAFWFFAALLFALFAIWQYNDPDPLLWGAIYGLAAVCALAAALQRYLPLLTFGLAFGCIVGAALLLPGFLTYLASGDLGALTGGMTPDRPYIEQSREFLGLCMVIALCVVLLVVAKRRKKSREANLT
jgi:hypothetical protein